MNINFVSMYDRKYFAQVVTACISILRNLPNANIFLFSLDASYLEDSWLIRFGLAERVTIIDVKNTHLQEIVLELEKTRKRIEVIFSLKPYFLEFILGNTQNHDYLVYFDADIFFYNNKLENLMKDEPELIVFQHQFSKRNEKFNLSGTYNAGLVVFKNSLSGRKLIGKWKNLCYQQCKVELKGKNHADQGYLEILVEEEKNTYIVSDLQFNQSTWALPIQFNRIKQYLSPSIYHFHGFRVRNSFFITNLNRYGFSIQNMLVYMCIYRVYIKQLSKNLEIIGASPEKSSSNPFNLIVLKEILTLERIYRY